MRKNPRIVRRGDNFGVTFLRARDWRPRRGNAHFIRPMVDFSESRGNESAKQIRIKNRVNICCARACGSIPASLLQCGRETQVVATVTNVSDSLALFHSFISRRSPFYPFSLSAYAREE